MSSKAKTLIPGGIEVGDGIACSVSPFSRFVVIDFYDGAIEGLAYIANTEYVVYFKKVWWDGHQNMRLFEGLVVSEGDIENFSKSLFFNFKKINSNANWSKSLSKFDKKIVDELVNAISGNIEKTKVSIFCKDIAGWVFIVSAFDEGECDADGGLPVV